jgi:hypothetical protein
MCNDETNESYGRLSFLEAQDQIPSSWSVFSLGLAQLFWMGLEGGSAPRFLGWGQFDSGSSGSPRFYDSYTASSHVFLLGFLSLLPVHAGFLPVLLTYQNMGQKQSLLTPYQS